MNNSSIVISPLVSIIIPFFNSEKFLQESIESIINQSYKNWELILVDDASNDSSNSIAQKFVNKYPDQIILYSHQGQKNLGASQARNIGLEHSKGQFIAFLDSDDIFYPNTIEQELLAFEKCPQADVVCGKLDFWHSWTTDKPRKEVDFTLNLGLELEKLYQPTELLIHNLKASGRKPGINSLMIKRDFINSIGAFEGDFRHVSEDQVFWAKVSLAGKIYVIDVSLAKYRQHPDSSCAVIIQNDKEIQNWEVFIDWLENYLKTNKVKDEEIWKALRYTRKEILFQKIFKPFKKIYRKFFSLRVRYLIRDKLISLKMRKK